MLQCVQEDSSEKALYKCSGARIHVHASAMDLYDAKNVCRRGGGAAVGANYLDVFNGEMGQE